jgi:hypothetical protein
MLAVLLVFQVLLAVFAASSMSSSDLPPLSSLLIAYDINTNEFWRQGDGNLTRIFSDLDTLTTCARLEKDYLTTLQSSFENPRFISAFKKAFSGFTTELISEILREGNVKVIRVLLESGLGIFFTEWKRINLAEIPGHVLHRFPIEFLPKRAFEVLPSGHVVQCILARAQANSFKNLWKLFKVAPKQLWKHPKIRSSIALRKSLNAFALADFAEQLKAAESSSSDSVMCSMFKEPFCIMVDLATDTDSLALESGLLTPLEFRMTVSWAFFVLQTFLHKAILEDFSDPIFLNALADRAISLQGIVSNYSRSDNSDLLRNCYSSEIYTLATDSVFTWASERFFPTGMLMADFSTSVRCLHGSDLVPGDDLVISFGSEMTHTLLYMLARDGLNNDDSTMAQFIEYFVVSYQSRNSLYRGIEVSYFGVTYLARFMMRNPIISLPLFLKIQECRSMNLFFHSVHHMVRNDPSFLVAFTNSSISNQEAYSHIKYGLILENTFVSSKSNSTFAIEFPDISQSFDDFVPEVDQYRYVNLYLSSSVTSDSPHFPVHSLPASFNTPNASMFLAGDSEDRQARSLAAESEFNSLTGSLNPVVPVEIKFIECFLGAMTKIIKAPDGDFIFSIAGSSVHGAGIITDCFHTFGRLISMDRLKTIEFVDSLDGFVPLPFTCPRIMAFIGLWMSLCLKKRIPISWTFAACFRKFLFSALPDNAELDLLVETIYKDYFDTIRSRFQHSSADSDFVGLLPRAMKVHRMFRIPQPYAAPASPFLFESYYFEKSNTSKLNSKKPLELEKYISFVKLHMRQSIIDGHEEFQRHFRLLFKPEFHNRLTFELIDEFICGIKHDPSTVLSALNCTGTADMTVINDFEGETGLEVLTVEELMKLMLSKLNEEQLGKFVWFATGSSQTVLGPRNPNKKIGILVRIASSSVDLCTAHVCYSQFTLVIHKNSARETFSKFFESICSSAGFSSAEF